MNKVLWIRNLVMLFSSETEKQNQMNRNCQHCVVNIDGYWYWQISPKKGEQHWQNSNVDCGVAACCHQGLMAHCSLCRLLINGGGRGQKKWTWSWTKRVKRETERVGNRQRFARTVIALSICPHQQNCQVLKSHSWKIIVKRGNYYFCPAADNWSA